LSRIISNDNVDKHVVKPYKFKELKDTDSDNFADHDDKNEMKIEYVETSYSLPSQQDKESKELIERLLNKIEELSNHILKIEDNFKAQLEECKRNIEIEKQKAFEEGYQRGFEEAKFQIEANVNEKIELLENSLKKVDELNKIFEEKIISIEKELISVALDIAKEVIQKEINENSKEIAYNLAKSLMDEVKDATKIKIKVNPKDAEFLKSKDFKNVEILEDPAVKEGGVIIISDIGNIDGEILSRFKAIKEAILEERNSED
jgi:flagellar assembly protein FliH